MNDQNVLETQLFLGKQVLEIIFDLMKDETIIGSVLPLKINGYKFKITVEKEAQDDSNKKIRKDEDKQEKKLRELFFV